MEVIIDDREQAILDYIPEMAEKYHIDYKIQRSEVGDYAIVYQDKILVIIERKTWKDLAASIRDGRKENIKKMINVRDKIGCRLAYLIEGDASPAFDKVYSNIPLLNLRAHLDHIAMRDNIIMLYSRDIAYTARRIFEFAQNCSTIKELCGTSVKSGGVDKSKKMVSKEKPMAKPLPKKRVIVKSGKKQGDLDRDLDLVKASDEENDKQDLNTEVKSSDKTVSQEDLNTEVKEEDLNTEVKEEDLDKEDLDELLNNNKHLLTEKQKSCINYSEQILRCLTAVGSIVSAVLAENNINLYKLYTETTINDIAILKYTTGAMIGAAKAKKIINSAVSAIETNNKTACRILASIPLISTKSAQSILSEVTLKEIMDKDIDIDGLARIQKTPKAKVGKKAAENIFKYLNLI